MSYLASIKLKTRKAFPQDASNRNFCDKAAEIVRKILPYFAYRKLKNFTGKMQGTCIMLTKANSFSAHFNAHKELAL